MVGKKKTFSTISAIIMILLAISCLLPFILLIISSITSEATLTKYGYSFLIRDLDISAYVYLFHSSKMILKAYGMTLIVVAIGMSVNVMFTIVMAYYLSKRDMPGRTFMSFFVFFTMLFSGGMIPSYIIWSRVIKVSDTIFGLLLPNLLLGPFNIIMMRTYFTTNIPQDILDAAELDGASQIRTMLTVAIPLSKPIISTIALFSALGYWNDWVNGLYYIVIRKDLQTIQIILNQLQNFSDFVKQVAANSSSGEASSLAANLPTLGLRMALAVASILPILLLYPFFQKQFVKGIVIGGVKG